MPPASIISRQTYSDPNFGQPPKVFNAVIVIIPVIAGLIILSVIGGLLRRAYLRDQFQSAPTRSNPPTLPMDINGHQERMEVTATGMPNPYVTPSANRYGNGVPSQGGIQPDSYPMSQVNTGIRASRPPPPASSSFPPNWNQPAITAPAPVITADAGMPPSYASTWSQP